MAVATLHNSGVVSWGGLFIDSIHAIKPLIYKFPLTLRCSLSRCFPTSLPACPQIHSTIYKASGGPTSYSLERSFLFPDLKSALLFLGCWLFLAARMPFLAPAPERGPAHPVEFMQSPFTLLARICLSLWATVSPQCLWMQTIKTWSLKIVLKPHELLWFLVD